MIRLLTFTTLYPNSKRPGHGVFVENRLRHLVASGNATSTVLAPVPYVPSLPRMPDRYAMWRGVPRREERHGIRLHHPRYFLLPKISMLAAPYSLFLSARRCLSELLESGLSFDAIDAHYFYPDGVAAILLGRHFGKPVTITARGSDINIIGRYRLPQRMISWAGREATAVIAVCEALRNSLIAMDVPGSKIRVLRNGVDLATFRPGDRAAARRCLGISAPMLLSVGNLIPLKGHDLAIEALRRLPEMQLVIVGDGPERSRLEQIATRNQVAQRVRFLGRVAHEALAEIYSAADATLLLSTNEGWANVLLESMACGTPVVATDTGGTPEVVGSPAVGQLVRERNAAAVAGAVSALFMRQPDRQAMRSYAEGFSWDATTRGQLSLFEDIIGGRLLPPVAPGWPAEVPAGPR